MKIWSRGMDAKEIVSKHTVSASRLLAARNNRSRMPQVYEACLNLFDESEKGH
jgi:hypothetical protein